MRERAPGSKKFNKKFFIFVSLISAILLTSYVAFKVYQYKTYIWLPDYFLHSEPNPIDKLSAGHVMFLIADHHEAGRGDRGFKRSNAWGKAYVKNVEGIRDDYGNPVQYTWFYAYDHLNSSVVFNLNKLVFAGLGEIELQWHHGPDTNETFPAKLKKALSWCNSHGFLLHVGPNPQPQFGFVHGNWALDNSSGNPNQCGVNRELDILKSHGGYADFTFSTLSTLAQPWKINSIYYAKDTDTPKSYDTGKDVEVGPRNSGFMIFQGPIACDWHDLIWDSAALESTSPFKPHRIDLWLKFAPTIKGRPEWLFVKVYTHGVQSKDVILSQQFRDMLFELKRKCREKVLSLHFVTAREAYNIVRAAEDGLHGNPEKFRDYFVKKPINRLVHVNTRIRNVVIDDENVTFDVVEPKSTSFSLHVGAIEEVSGIITRYAGRREDNGTYTVTVEGKGTIRATTREHPVFKNEILSFDETDPEGYHYILKAR